jgi:hypothetical protein
MTKIPRSVLTSWDSVAAPIPTFELVPGTLFSKLRTHKTRQSGTMSIRQWLSFLERNCRLFWHQRATNLMYEIEEDGDCEFLSWSSSISSNMSMNSRKRILSSTQCQSNTRLYSVERENISTWKKFNRKVNTWNGILINLRSVSVTVYIQFKCTIGPKYRFIDGPSKTEMTISRTQNRS